MTSISLDREAKLLMRSQATLPLGVWPVIEVAIVAAADDDNDDNDSDNDNDEEEVVIKDCRQTSQVWSFGLYTIMNTAPSPTVIQATVTHPTTLQRPSTNNQAHSGNDQSLKSNHCMRPPASCEPSFYHKEPLSTRALLLQAGQRTLVKVTNTVFKALSAFPY